MIMNETRSGFWTKIISFCAFATWSASLPFTVFLLKNGEEWSGASVLLFGLFSVLLPNFAWFANIFFLYACIKIHFGSKPVSWSVIIAIILSADSFRLTELPNSIAIDNYGWGFVLWFLSLFILAIAAGTQWATRKHDDIYKFAKLEFYFWRLLKPLVIFLVLSTLCLSLFLLFNTLF